MKYLMKYAIYDSYIYPSILEYFMTYTDICCQLFHSHKYM